MNHQKVFIITEAGKKNGFGHLTRCTAIYDALKERGAFPELIINSDENAKVLLKNKSCAFFNWLKRKNRLFKIIAKGHIVIVDSYLADVSFYKLLSKLVRVPVYIDDNVRLEYPRGIVINASIYSKGLDYFKDKDSVYLLGSQYIPLRKEFWQGVSKKIRTNIRSVLITLGGNDPGNMTPKILKFLADAHPEFIRNVVIGKGFRNVQQLMKFKDKKTKLIFYPSAYKMKQLMLESDFAICAGGQTTYELACVGVPAVGICYAENQVRNLDKWQNIGFLEYIGWYNDANLIKKLHYAVKKLDSKELRLKMSKIGRKCLDGQGAKKIVEKIYSYAYGN